MIFVHLGAGAGDLDQGANFRCGFTEFIKKNSKVEDEIYLIEANLKNIDKLKKSFYKFQNAKIINLAITDKAEIQKIQMFYTEDDAPHYQTCSCDKRHVLKHYPNSFIKSFDVSATTINNLFTSNNIREVDFLSIDLEGIDYEILMSINLDKFNVKNISVEFLHLTKRQKKNIVNHLLKFGYTYCGFGYDHNNFDFLFRKRKIWSNILLSKILWLIGKKHLKYFNKIIFKN